MEVFALIKKENLESKREDTIHTQKKKSHYAKALAFKYVGDNIFAK